MFHWKLEEVEFPLCMSWHFATIKKHFRNQLLHAMITYPFPFQAYPSSMSESTVFLPYISWLSTCLPLWVAHIFLIFSLSFSFWIKPFRFLSMTTLLCYPCHKNCFTLISFIYSLNAHYVQLVLTDVGFLKAHLSTSLSPSNSAPHLGYRLEFILSTGGLHALMASSLADNHGNSSMFIDCQILQVARH